MGNIIKSLNYQLKRDNGMIYIYLVVLFIFIASFISYLDSYDFGETTGSLFTILNAETYLIGAGLTIALLAARAFGWDYNDKTINYEVLSGHSRKEIYISRVLVSMCWSLISCFLLLYVPLLFYTACNGWGNWADIRGVMLRYVLLLFPLFRFVCECILLTVVMKNCYMAMIIGFVLYEFSWALTTMQELLTEYAFTIEFASTNIYRLLVYNKYSFGYMDGEDFITYDTILEPSLLVGTILVSTIVGVVCLIVGYFYFLKKDMD